MRSDWSDDRLDEFAVQTDRRFDRLERRMETGFAEIRKEMGERFDKVDKRFDKLEARFDKIDERFEKVDKRFERVDERFERVDERFERVDERFERVDERFEALHFMMHKTMVQLTFALGGTVAFGFLGIIVTQILK